MYKIILLLSAMYFFHPDSTLGQKNIYDGVLLNHDSPNAVMFCGKTPNSESILSINVEELKKCDWHLTAGPEALQIIEFKITIIPKLDKFRKTEAIAIKGNEIPIEYRDRILFDSVRFFVDDIKANNLKKDVINLNLMTISVIP
jgi:hypothetical protein